MKLLSQCRSSHGSALGWSKCPSNRSFIGLFLSQFVVPIAVRIASIEGSQSCAFQLVSGASSLPHAHVMAVLVVTLKLLYGLDGQTRRLPEGLAPPPVWLQWAEEAIRRAPKPSLVRLSPNKACSLHNINCADHLPYPFQHQ